MLGHIKLSLKELDMVKQIGNSCCKIVSCPTSYLTQGCQFHSVSSGMAETFHTNSKNRTKRNNFHLISNLGLFWIFQLNFGRNVPVSFHMFHSGLEKPLNQIEPDSI